MIRSLVAAAAICLIAANSFAYWTGIDLQPSGFTNTSATSIYGSLIGGFGSGTATSNKTHALLWNRSTGTYTDLNPSGYEASKVLGVYGEYQVGYASNLINYGTKEIQVPMVWHGTAASATRLQFPSLGDEPSIWSGRANAISGNTIVGDALMEDYERTYMGLVWDLATGACTQANGLGWYGGSYMDVDGNKIVGYQEFGGYMRTIGDLPGGQYGVFGDQVVGSSEDWFVDVMGPVEKLAEAAMLWVGTTPVQLHYVQQPFGTTAAAVDTNGTMQVGYAFITDKDRALAWSGTAESEQDLSLLLPGGLTGDSYASSINSTNDIVGYAYDSSGNTHAVLWQVPEPATLSLLLFGALGLLRRRK